MPPEIVAVAQTSPWYVLLAAGIFMTPILCFMLWRWFTKESAGVSVDGAAKQASDIYRTLISDTEAVIKTLTAAKDAAESRYSELLMRVAGMTDQLVSMQASLSKQTEQMRSQAEQLENQASELMRAKETIVHLTTQINTLEGRINGTA